MTDTQTNGATGSLRRWKRAGLFSELDSMEALPLLDEADDDPLSPTLLRYYYAANGDMVEAIWRRQADRYVDVSRSQLPDTVLKLIELADPSLGPLRATETADALHIRAGSDVTTISRVVRAHQLRAAPERPRDVVEAVNQLLAGRGQRRRFVELRGDEGRHVFVALEPRQARTLQGWGVTRHADVGTLWRFAGWDRVAVVSRAV